MRPLHILIPLLAGLGCARSQPFAPLAPAPETAGPRVVFDTLAKPLPEIPFPNDIATRPDPDSATGLRVNASLIAPTLLEKRVRGLLDRLDGFGTFAPITVSFDGDLDVLDLWRRQNDGDPRNDAVYLIDLETGAPQALDVGAGRYPLTLSRPDQFFLNDPYSNVFNLLFPVEGPFANVLHPIDPAWASTHGGVPQAVDDLMTFYERETRTLILRPLKPLQQQHKYAVVLTRRLLGTGGAPVGGPRGFAGVAHALQAKALEGLPQKLPAGTSLSDVAFTWAFTTQSVTRDLEAIREGLYGRGALGWLSATYPMVRDGVHTMAPMRVLDSGANVYVMPTEKIVALLSDPAVLDAFGLDANSGEATALLDTFKYVSHLVAGTFTTPDFLAEAGTSPFDEVMNIDLRRGTARTTPGPVPFLLAVPKQIAGRKAPFPVAIYGHGYTSAHFEGVLGFGGSLAKHGIATVAIDSYGHGLGVDPTLAALLKAVLAKHGLGAFADAIVAGRARDLDNDGVVDSGADFWSADAFHTRDVVRQSIVDWMQLVRVLRSFDGTAQMKLADGAMRVAGDWDGDGVPDVGGADNGYYVFGSSLGGILSSILPAVEPAIRAAAPIAGGSGLTDIGIRSIQGGVVQAVYLEIMGPLVASCNYSLEQQRCGGKNAEPMLVFDIQRGNQEARVPFARAQLVPGDVVTACNLSHPDAAPRVGVHGDKIAPGCSQARVDAKGGIRIPIAADGPQLQAKRTPQSGLPDKVDVAVKRPGDSLLVTIEPASGGAYRTITNFEVDTSFLGVKYTSGAPLQSLARGYGRQRNTPEFRRIQGLSQLMLEPGDPANYAAHYIDGLLPLRTQPANVMVVGTVGDLNVPINSAIATARAANILDDGKPAAGFTLPAEEVLRRGGVHEGVARLRRFADERAGPRAELAGHVRCESGSRCGDEILLDPTGYSCDENGQDCRDGFGGPRLSPPLREQMMRTTASGVSALVMPYMRPTGQHGIANPQPSKPFNMDQFMINMIGLYFSSDGKQIRFDRCQEKLAECAWIPKLP